MSMPSFSVQIVDNITNYPIETVDVWLYKYPVSVSGSGIVTGTRAKTLEGADIKGTNKKGGVYVFEDVPTGEYAIVIGSVDIMTRVLKGYERVVYVDVIGKDIYDGDGNKVG